MTIPKRIHQIWIGPKPAPSAWMQSWKDAHPKWEYRVWDEKAILGLKMRNDRAFRDYCKAGIYDAASDIARGEILLKHGGVYIDADSECARPLDDAPFLQAGFFVMQEIPPQNDPAFVVGSFMGCVPGHPTTRAFVKAQTKARIPCKHKKTGIEYDCAWINTGTGVLKKVLGLDRPDDIMVLPPWVFFTHTIKGARVTGGKPYGVHKWSSTVAHFKDNRFARAAVPYPSAGASSEVYCSVCLPTRGRPKRFTEMYESILETAELPLEVIAVFDSDDETRSDYPEGPTYVTVEAGTRNVSDLWNVAWEHATGKIAHLGSDDLLYRTKGWDKQVRGAFKAWDPDYIGMVYPNDLMVNPAGNHEPYMGQRPEHELPGGGFCFPCNPFVSHEWIEAAGSFTVPYFKSWETDTWMYLLSRELRRVQYLHETIIENMHPLAGKAKLDATYRRGAWFNEKLRQEMHDITFSAKSIKERAETAARMKKHLRRRA